jgi:hypothetical protein
MLLLRDVFSSGRFPCRYRSVLVRIVALTNVCVPLTRFYDFPWSKAFYTSDYVKALDMRDYPRWMGSPVRTEQLSLPGHEGGAHKLETLP